MNPDPVDLVVFLSMLSLLATAPLGGARRRWRGAIGGAALAAVLVAILVGGLAWSALGAALGALFGALGPPPSHARRSGGLGRWGDAGGSFGAGNFGGGGASGRW